ncbi:MAG TPA: YtxH domain-containing protein [Anaerolineales bacterium]|nr:YtxH domain-containing protein [Anaerolineales bacterium]
MENRIEDYMEHGYYRTSNAKGFIAGLLIGSAAGAATMLLMAPQSGKDTRAQIKDKSIELKDQTVKAVEDTVTQVRTQVGKAAASVQNAAESLPENAKKLANEQKERWAPVAKAGKNAIQG